MKILMIVSSMHPKHGGVSQGIRNSIPELQKMGIEHEVVCLDDPNSDYLGQDPFVIHAIGKSRGPWSYNKELSPWLLANFHRFDAVIIHGLWLYTSYATTKAIRKYRKKHTSVPKVYVMTHGMLDPYFQKAAARRLKAVRNEIYWKFIEKKVINQADGVLFTCEEELLLARTTFPNYNPKREINVGYGVHTPPNYEPIMREAFVEKVPQWNGKPHFVFLSRVHSKKGVDLLIKAYLRLEKELGSLPQLIIAGPGLDQPYGAAMQELASTSANIIFPGMLSGDAKWGALYESEAFVLPSHQENFGIAVVEALACEKPVLISNKVNIWREIEKGNGGIVKEDTATATYALLKNWLILAKEEQFQMAKDAQKVYLEHFTIAQACKQLLSSIC